jgi:hypothetical protein
VLGLALLGKARYGEAIEEFGKSQRGASGSLGNAYAVAGRRAEALKVLNELKARYERDGIGAANIAQLYIGLREYDRALAWLETEARDGGLMLSIAVAPVFDPLRSDPRFGELLRQFGYAL